MQKRPIAVLFALLLVSTGLTVEAQAQSDSKPSSKLQYSRAHEDVEGDGYMVGGDLWDTVKPYNTKQTNKIGSPYRNLPGGGFTSYMHLGSNDADFFSPGGMWPNAYRTVNLFRNARKLGLTAFEPDGWPGYQVGNPIYDITAGADSPEKRKYMVAMYGQNVPGASDPARNYQREARYTDETRTHLIYEAGWPTTMGVDFKVRAHQYTPNEQNLNDFVVMEITLTNTGVVDTDGNGTPEATGHVIDALAFSAQLETAPAIKIGFGGDRTLGPDGGSFFGAGRTFGYVGAPDENGNPYDIGAFFANVPPGVTSNNSVPPAGRRDFGTNNYPQKEGYTDIWGGWQWMGVKQGSIGDVMSNSGSIANLSAMDDITADSPDKATLFGTHPIGEGPERGWYTSHTFQPQLVTYRWNDAVKEFRAATAVWYQDYGRTSADPATSNLQPNSNFFLTGVPGDVTTFVPNPLHQRPNGDYKYGPLPTPTRGSGVQQPIWEPEWNPSLKNNASPSDADFYKAIGYNREWTFGESNKNGVGPFRLEVGESMTVVFVATAGYRFEGIRDATKAAHWAWERGWDVQDELPVPPAPDVKVESTPAGTALVHWTNVTDIDPDVDGYKIWRAAQYQRKDFMEEGMRLADRFQKQHEVGASKDALLDPVNPYWDAEQYAFGGSETAGTYQPEEWGTYELIAKIPTGSVSEYLSDGGAYDYTFEDPESITGFTYWYYVSTYKEGGSWSGPLGPVQGHLESSGVVNRNGRNSPDATEGQIGMPTSWLGVYPFAWNDRNYPAAGTARRKNLGAAFTVTPPVAAVQDVERLITVSPNPYHVTALNDVRTDPSYHVINFLNVPAEFTLTVMDVSGQIIFRDQVEAGSNGLYPWRAFSKDGVEIASGLYIYHIQYGEGQEVVGQFAILR